MKKRLSEKQRRFVEFYTGECQGNATESARRAGYAHPTTAGPRMLENAGISRAIEAATAEVRQSAIMTREERQKWLTAVARGEECRAIVMAMEGPVLDPQTGEPLRDAAPAKDRVRSVELLGKMQGDYIEKLELKLLDLFDGKLDELEKRLDPEAFDLVCKVLEGEG